jgi:outer membrane murein-binding lipoprotein Lpp
MALFEIHHHYHDRITNQKLDKIMGKLEDLLAKQDQIDTTIDEVKKDLDFIKGQLGQGTEGGLSAEQVATLEARVDQTLAKLQGLDAETDSSTPPAPEA